MPPLISLVQTGTPETSIDNNVPIELVASQVPALVIPNAEVPLPYKIPLEVKVVAPVPPLPTANVAERPAAVPEVF